MGVKATTASVIAALRKHAGVQAFAAREVGITRSAMCRRIQTNPRVAAAVEEIKREVEEQITELGPLLKTKIADLIEAGDAATIRWAAERLLRDQFGASTSLRLDDAQIEALLARATPEAVRTLAGRG